MNRQLCVDFLKSIKQCQWKTYSEFVKSFQELRVISLNENDWNLSTCTCPSCTNIIFAGILKLMINSKYHFNSK
ncbi:hypothetical protein BpHYR1_005779, partial [Brachionus plicatilis]